MKKLKIALILAVIFGAGVVSADIAKYAYKQTTNNTVLNGQYFDENNYKVYRFQDNTGNGTTTCYTVEYEVYRGVNNQRGVSLNCVK